MDYNFSDDFLIKENSKFEIKKHNTSYKGKINKDEAKELLEIEKEKLRLLQEKLYADGSQSLLIVLQAMDAAGKDSLIKQLLTTEM